MNDTIKNGTTDKPPVSAIIEACRLHYGDRHKRVFEVVEQFLVDYLLDDRSEAVFLEKCVRAEPKAVKALNNRKDAEKIYDWIYSAYEKITIGVMDVDVDALAIWYISFVLDLVRLLKIRVRELDCFE